ncbi:hypothetical protein Tco_1342970 [Tanacetum coccineum]
MWITCNTPKIKTTQRNGNNGVQKRAYKLPGSKRVRISEKQGKTLYFEKHGHSLGFENDLVLYDFSSDTICNTPKILSQRNEQLAEMHIISTTQTENEGGWGWCEGGGGSGCDDEDGVGGVVMKVR